MTIYKKAENNYGILKILYDESAESPREWDNLGKMVCWHRRYNLGDKHSYRDTRDMLECEVRSYYSSNDLISIAKSLIFTEQGVCQYYIKSQYGDLIAGTKDEILDEINYTPMEYIPTDKLWDLFLENHITLPLYLYDHSGITMNTDGFTCSWDSGQVGWIYATKDRFRTETGYSETQLFKEGKAEELLKGEVATYDNYLTGRVYGYKLEKKIKCACCSHTETEFIDSCYGFYGNAEQLEKELKGYIPEEYHELIGKLEYVY